MLLGPNPHIEHGRKPGGLTETLKPRVRIEFLLRNSHKLSILRRTRVCMGDVARHHLKSLIAPKYVDGRCKFKRTKSDPEGRRTAAGFSLSVILLQPVEVVCVQHVKRSPQQHQRLKNPAHGVLQV